MDMFTLLLGVPLLLSVIAIYYMFKRTQNKIVPIILLCSTLSAVLTILFGFNLSSALQFFHTTIDALWLPITIHGLWVFSILSAMFACLFRNSKISDSASETLTVVRYYMLWLPGAIILWIAGLIAHIGLFSIIYFSRFFIQ